MTANVLAVTPQNIFKSTGTNQWWSGLAVDTTIEQLIFENAARRYYFTLTDKTGTYEDIEIPIKSFQTRLQKDSDTYLAVVIPDINQVIEINRRKTGDLVVEMAYWLDGQDHYRTEISRAAFEMIREDTGGVNKSITLSGYAPKLNSNAIVALSNAYTYKSQQNGKLLLRYPEPNVFLKPGNTATVEGYSFTVGQIIMYVDSNSSNTEILEA